MNTVILVVAFWGARLLRDFLSEIIMNRLPEGAEKGKKLLFKVISFAVGWAAFLLYVYFAGYYIMDKEANMSIALIIALVPNLAIYGYKLFSRSAIIE